VQRPRELPRTSSGWGLFAPREAAAAAATVQEEVGEAAQDARIDEQPELVKGHDVVAARHGSAPGRAVGSAPAAAGWADVGLAAGVHHGRKARDGSRKG
jgi:hypothetical protein